MNRNNLIKYKCLNVLQGMLISPLDETELMDFFGEIIWFDFPGNFYFLNFLFF